MTRKEVIGLMAIIEVAYPGAFSAKSERQKLDAIEVYADFFEADDPKLVYAAVKSIIAGNDSPYAPKIGEIKARMQELTRPEGELTESEAWALVARACRRGYYNAQEEYDKLPPVVQAAVGSPNQIRAWSMIDEDEFQTVVASNFMRSYRIHVKRARADALLPPSVRELLKGVGTTPTISEPETVPQIEAGRAE